jgi:hypothetical protein
MKEFNKFKFGIKNLWLDPDQIQILQQPGSGSGLSESGSETLVIIMDVIPRSLGEVMAVQFLVRRQSFKSCPRVQPTEKNKAKRR